MKRIILGLALCLGLAASPAMAHFQLVHTPELALEQGGELHLSIVFSHPFDAGYTMDMETPEAFYMVSQRGDGEPRTTDLMSSLKPISWKSTTNTGKAFEAKVPVRSMGDHIFVLVPSPYYEKEEDAYIQQITKNIVNVAGMPGHWNEPLGLKAEIVPLDKPYALWTGNVFRGVVLSDGKPVPGAEIEVEYLNHEPLQNERAFAEKGAIEAPQAAFEVQTIFADENGVFTYGLPRAGYWGFAALGVGPDDELNGKELSQDAVIWVRAVDMK